MKVKNFLLLPSGTLIRKSSIQSLEPVRYASRIDILCLNTEPHYLQINEQDNFQEVLLDLYCQLNEKE